MVLPIVRRVFAAVLAGVILGTASLASAAALGQREALPNGLVLVVSEQHAVPIVAIQLLLRTGSMDDPQGKSGLANLTAQLLSQGTTTRTAPQISEAIEFIGASLDIEPGLETTTITLSLLSKDLDLGRICWPMCSSTRRFGPTMSSARSKKSRPGSSATKRIPALCPFRRS